VASDLKIAFLVGSVRSGTTILGNILDYHRDIRQWHEPYFIWENHFSVQDDDVWSREEMTEKAKKSIRNEFFTYARLSGNRLVVDKSPLNVFNIDIIKEIFPEALWLHIFRDGRDVTLSIKKEWEKRAAMVTQRNYKRLFRVGTRFLNRQPFWRYRMKAILFELKNNASINPRMYLNKSKWQGNIGWGPRFKDWREYLDEHSLIEFHAQQWAASVEAILTSWPRIKADSKLEVRYEDLLQDRHGTLGRILEHLGCDVYPEFFESIPELYARNFHKWEKELSADEIAKIEPIVLPVLESRGDNLARE
jgi:hypothetical protein